MQQLQTEFYSVALQVLPHCMQRFTHFMHPLWRHSTLGLVYKEIWFIPLLTKVIGDLMMLLHNQIT